MIGLEKEDIFELYYVTEEDEETGGTIFILEYGSGLTLNLLILKKLLGAWGYKITEQQDWKCDWYDEGNKDTWEFDLAVYSDFPYKDYIKRGRD